MRSWSAGSIRWTRLPSPFQKASSLATAAASLSGSGVRMHQRPVEQVERRAASGPEFSVPATGCGRHEVHALRNVRRHVGDHGLLHRADVGDDAARLEAGRDGARGLARRRRPACRRSPGRHPCRLPRDRCRNGRPVSACWRSRPSPRCASRRRSWWRGRAPRGERDRAADQADADQGDLVEHRLRSGLGHLLAATKRPSEACTAFTSLSVPMVMRRCSGRP